MGNQLNSPYMIVIDVDGEYIISDYGNSRVVKCPGVKDEVDKLKDCKIVAGGHHLHGPLVVEAPIGIAIAQGLPPPPPPPPAAQGNASETPEANETNVTNVSAPTRL